MEKITTLEDWIKAMMKANPNARLSNKTANNIFDIFICLLKNGIYRIFDSFLRIETNCNNRY